MDDPDSMEIFLDQLDEPFDIEDREQDSFFQSSQSQTDKTLIPSPVKEVSQVKDLSHTKRSLLSYLSQCPGHTCEEAAADVVLAHENDSKPDDVRLMGVKVGQSEAFTLGFHIFVKAVNTLEAPGAAIIEQSKFEECSRSVHKYLGLLRSCNDRPTEQLQHTVEKIVSVIGPLSDLKPDIGKASKVFGSKDCFLALHAMLAAHVTAGHMVQSYDSLVEFLAWCAVQRSKVVDRLSDNLLNCFCVKACWRLAFKSARTEEDFWSSLATQFINSPIDFWPTLRAIANMVSPDSTCFTNVLQTCLKNSLAQQPSPADMLVITTCLKFVPANILSLSQLWNYHVSRLNDEETPKSNALGFNYISQPGSILAWKTELMKTLGTREPDTAYSAFLQLVKEQLSQAEPAKAVQFLNRIRSNLPRKVPDLNPTGIRRVIDLLLVTVLSRSDQLTKQLLDAVTAILKSKPSAKTLDLFVRGSAACVLLASEPAQLFSLFMSRLEDCPQNMRSTCVATYCDLIVERADHLIHHDNAILSDILVVHVFSKPLQTNVLGQFLKAMSLLMRKMDDYLQKTSNVTTLSSEERDIRDKVEANVRRVEARVGPRVRGLWQITSVEEAVSPLSLVKDIVDFVSVAGDTPTLTDAQVHPSLTCELTLRSVMNNGVIVDPHVAAWVKCLCLLAPEDTAELSIAVTEGLAELKVFRRSVQEASPYATFFAALNNKINYDSSEAKLQQLHSRYRQVFHVFKEVCRTWLPGLVKEQLLSQKVLQFYRVGASMVKHCCALLYPKDPSATKFLSVLLGVMYISPSLKNPSYNIPNTQLKAIHLCLSDVLQGIGTLDQITANGYLNRAMREIVTAYLPRYPVNKSHPFFKTFDAQGGGNFYYDTVDFKSLASLLFKAIREQHHTNPDALNLVKLLVKDSPKRVELCSAAVKELAPSLLDLRIKSQHRKVQTACKELVNLFVSCNASWMVTPLENFIHANLCFHRVTTFGIIREVSEINSVLAKAIVPAVENAIAMIEAKSPLGLETLKAQLKELKSKYQ